MTASEALARVLAAAAIILTAAAGTAGAATLYVANNGTDSPTCGTLKDPCRSITQAIGNAKAKDRIVVGPGRYGDLNWNGILGEPGEESAVGCMVCLSKPLTLESEEGAGATILDAGGVFTDVVAVGVEGNGSVIGKPSKGFTFSGGWHGLVTVNDPFVSELTVSGNIAVNSLENGFLFHADTGQYTVAENLAIHNGTDGFFSHGGAGHTFRGNAAIANGLSGFRIDGGAGHALINNVAIGNTGAGFYGLSDGLTFKGNAAIANKGRGIIVVGTTATLTQNNLYGNDFTDNCGLWVGGSTSASAINNYFGAATGPGPDPADDVCIADGGIATVTPSATKEFPVSTTWK